MRKIHRSSEPDILVQNASKWNSQWTDLKAKNPSAQFNWYRVDGKSARDWILPDLAAMTQGHCAFCDRFTVEPESVEHFRPKSDSRFLHLAYSWENLFFCCGGCQNEKREQWDELLLNPDANDYSFSRYFVFDFTIGSISPNPRASAEDQSKARATIQIYGLDTLQRRRFRRLELKRWLNSKSLSINSFAYRDFVENPE